MKLLFLSSSRKKWILAVKSPFITHPLVQHWILVKSSVQGSYPVQIYQAQMLMVPCWLGEQLKKFLPIAVYFLQLEFVPSLLSTLLLHQARLIKKCSLISCSTLAASAQGCQYEIGSSALGYPTLVTSVTGLSTWDSEENCDLSVKQLLFGLNFLLVVPDPGVYFSRGLWFFSRFLSPSVKLELLRLVSVEIVELYHNLRMGGKSVKNMSSLYLGESFPFLSISSFRAKPARGSLRCRALWRGKTGKHRPCVLLELLCQHRAGIVEGEHLHHMMNCTILLFLKQSFHELSQQWDRRT